MADRFSEKIRSLHLDEFLDYYTELIEGRLKVHFRRFSKEAEKYHPFIGIVTNKSGEYVLRKGKRIASCSALLTYQGYTDRVNEDILRICTAIEFYRHSILLHDDLVDMDDMRRGRRAFHRLFLEEYDERFGEGTAIFFGNIFYSEALKLLFKTRVEKKRLLKVIELISTGYKEVNESQVLDLLFEYKEPNIMEWEIMASKRAASLFKVNMLTGAILGGATPKELRFVEEGAIHIGYSFDIQDDIIGTFATEEQYGRLPGGDIILGKKPLHIVYAYQLAEGREREKLRKLLANKMMDEDHVERVKEIVKSCGALDKAKERSKEHGKTALKIVQKTSMNNYAKKFFMGLIEYVLESLDWYK